MPTDTFIEKFEFPVLTPIAGALNYPVLKKLKDEIKADAAAIYSELGGGAHGHLGLVSTASEYQKVSATPYIRHQQPKRPTINAAMLEHMVQKKLDE